jgi:uncharacterized membrane protein YccC
MDNFGKWLGAHLKLRVHFALGLRVTLAALVALVAAQVAGLPLPLWSVLTAVIVTQMSVGRTLKASIDYMLGTIGGSIYGGAVAVLIPHTTSSRCLPCWSSRWAAGALRRAPARHERGADLGHHRVAGAGL